MAVFEAEIVRLGVEQLQGFDLVLVLLDELAEAGDQRLGVFFGLLAEANLNQLILGDLVDDLLAGAAAALVDGVTEVGVIEGL